MDPVDGSVCGISGYENPRPGRIGETTYETGLEVRQDRVPESQHGQVALDRLKRISQPRVTNPSTFDTPNR